MLVVLPSAAVTPGGGAAVSCRLLQVLGSARSSIMVCVFTITCDDIADALMQAHRRGVQVRVITDNDQVCW